SGKCKDIEMTFRETEDGKMVHECGLYDEWGRKEVDTVETDNENYAIIKISKSKGGQKICHVITLFAREPVITAEYAEKLKSAAKEAGIAEENVIFFPPEVACQEEALLAGRWYPISVVMDYEPLGSLNVVGRAIVPMRNGNMDVDFETFENGHCILRMSIYWRTNTQGKFIVDRFTLRVVETDYDNYLIFHLDAGDKSALYLDASRRALLVVQGDCAFPTMKRDAPPSDLQMKSMLASPAANQRAKQAGIQASAVGKVGHSPRENCKLQRTWLTKSSKPGVFETKHSVIYILETDYTSYAILCVETASQNILHLNSRAPEASEVARERFNYFADILGLPIHRTVYLNKAVPC
ncbi:hypothetical protein JRQ81_008602, partial [Phrynocephalus forsythii]